MKVLLICLEFDCAGVGWNLRNALRALGHEAMLVVHRTTHAAANADVVFKGVDQILPLCEWADVLHFNQWIWTHIPGHAPLEFKPGNEYGHANGQCPFTDVLKRKRVVFHFHGGRHQLLPDYWVEECRHRSALVLKCDPICPVPGARWIPNVLDVENCQPATRAGPVSVACMGDVSDSRRVNRMVAQALTTVQVPHVFFGEVPRPAALEARRCHRASMDNTTQGFVGMWTWEGLAMGQACFGRLALAVENAYWNQFGVVPPIQNVANCDEFACAIRRLREADEELVAIQEAGRKWTEDFNDPARIAGLYLAGYQC